MKLRSEASSAWGILFTRLLSRNGSVPLTWPSCRRLRSSSRAPVTRFGKPEEVAGYKLSFLYSRALAGGWRPQLQAAQGVGTDARAELARSR